MEPDLSMPFDPNYQPGSTDMSCRQRIAVMKVAPDLISELLPTDRELCLACWFTPGQTRKALHKRLLLPENCTILAVSEYALFFTGHIALRLECPDFIEIVPTSIIPEVEAWYRRSSTDKGALGHFYHWSGSALKRDYSWVSEFGNTLVAHWTPEAAATNLSPCGCNGDPSCVTVSHARFPSRAISKWTCEICHLSGFILGKDGQGPTTKMGDCPRGCDMVREKGPCTIDFCSCQCKACRYDRGERVDQE